MRSNMRIWQLVIPIFNAMKLLTMSRLYYVLFVGKRSKFICIFAHHFACKCVSPLFRSILMKFYLSVNETEMNVKHKIVHILFGFTFIFRLYMVAGTIYLFLILSFVVLNQIAVHRE